MSPPVRCGRRGWRGCADLNARSVFAASAGSGMQITFPRYIDKAMSGCMGRRSTGRFEQPLIGLPSRIRANFPGKFHASRMPEHIPPHEGGINMRRVAGPQQPSIPPPSARRERSL